MKNIKNILIIVILYSFIFPQLNTKGIKTSGTMGSATIDGEIYNQIAIRPEIPIGKMGIGLDLYLYFNSKGIYSGNWDFKDGQSSYRTIIDKIYYIRWGQPGESLYFRIGALNQVSLGHGILVNNYSNTMQYPEIRRIGLDYRMQITHNIALDVLHSNFKNYSAPSVLGARIAYDMTPRIEYGLSIVGDPNQYAGLSDRDGDNVPDALDDFPDDGNYDVDTDNDGTPDAEDPDLDGDGLDTFHWNADTGSYEEDDQDVLDALQTLADEKGWELDADNTWTNVKLPFNTINNKRPIYAVGLDFTFKLNNKIKLYGQYGMLDSEDGQGWGFSFPGFYTKFGPFNFRAEYRQCSEQFIYSYWDRSYDLTRANVKDETIITKSNQLADMSAMRGYFLNASSDIFGYIWIDAAYQDLYSDDNGRNKSFQTNINLNTEKIPKLEVAKAFYQRSNDENIFDFDNPSPSTVYGYDIGFKVSKGMTMVYKNRITYKVDANNKVVSVPIMQIETQMKF